MTMLIIDDNLICRQILCAIVAPVSNGHQDSSLSCPINVLDWTSKYPVAPILTDYQMPKMNGIDFIRAFRKTPSGSHAPAVMVSTDVEVRDKAIQAGVTGFLEKPVDHNECQNLCQSLLMEAT